MNIWALRLMGNRLLVIYGLVLIVAAVVAAAMGDVALTVKLLLSIWSCLPIFMVINLLRNKWITVVTIAFAVILTILFWLLT